MATQVLNEIGYANHAVLARNTTYEEFLDWPGENQHLEWVGGEVIAMSPISAEHQEIGAFLLASLRAFVEERNLGRVLHDPFQMKIGAVGRAPDILFVAKSNLSRLTKNYLDGPADLVIEIISPGSRAVDSLDKLREYEAGGVPEYWLIDPERLRVVFYQMQETGAYREVAVGGDGIYHSAEIDGLWLREAWLWQPPKLMDVLREWKLI